jgi:hypothetical protein
VEACSKGTGKNTTLTGPSFDVEATFHKARGFKCLSYSHMSVSFLSRHNSGLAVRKFGFETIPAWAYFDVAI